MSGSAGTHHGVGHHASEGNYSTSPKGIWSWVVLVHHKRIALMYLFTLTFFFFLGGVAALILRTELMHAGKDFLEPEQYNILFTLHGAIMIFLFIVPGIPSIMGTFLPPDDRSEGRRLSEA